MKRTLLFAGLFASFLANASGFSPLLPHDINRTIAETWNQLQTTGLADVVVEDIYHCYGARGGLTREEIWNILEYEQYEERHLYGIWDSTTIIVGDDHFIVGTNTRASLPEENFAVYKGQQWLSSYCGNARRCPNAPEWSCTVTGSERTASTWVVPGVSVGDIHVGAEVWTSSGDGVFFTCTLTISGE